MNNRELQKSISEFITVHKLDTFLKSLERKYGPARASQIRPQEFVAKKGDHAGKLAVGFNYRSVVDGSVIIHESGKIEIEYNHLVRDLGKEFVETESEAKQFLLEISKS